MTGTPLRYVRENLPLAAGANLFYYFQPKGQKHILDLISAGVEGTTMTGKVTVWFVTADGFHLPIINDEPLTAANNFVSVNDCSIFLDEGDGIKWQFENMVAADLARIGVVGH